MTTTILPKLVRTRSWLTALSLGAIAIFAAGCGRVTPAASQASVDSAPRTASAVRTCQGQLVDTDAELRALSGCTEIAGDLRIHSTNVTSLSALSRLRAVQGTLEISDNRHLSTLSGLDRLSRVQRLTLRNNPRLASLAALANLRSLRSLALSGAPSLVSASGLNGIRRLETLSVEGTALATLSGLSNLRVVQYLTLRNNPYLVSVGALGRVEEASSLEVRDNPLLYGGPEEFFPRLLRADKVSLSGNFSMSRGEVAAFERRVVVVPGAAEAVAGEAVEIHASR